MFTNVSGWFIKLTLHVHVDMYNMFAVHLGYETVRALSMHGCHVVIGCRNMRTANAAVKRIKSERSAVAIEVMPLDLASFRSVKQMVENYCNRGW